MKSLLQPIKIAGTHSKKPKAFKPRAVKLGKPKKPKVG
jgi:hypothetical protein